MCEEQLVGPPINYLTCELNHDMFGARIKIIWEEQLFDPPIHYLRQMLKAPPLIPQTYISRASIRDPTEWHCYVQNIQIIDEAVNFRRIAIQGRSICRSLHHNL